MMVLEMANEVRTMVVGKRWLLKMKTEISSALVMMVMIAMMNVKGPRIGISQSAFNLYL